MKVGFLILNKIRKVWRPTKNAPWPTSCRGPPVEKLCHRAWETLWALFSCEQWFKEYLRFNVQPAESFIWIWVRSPSTRGYKFYERIYAKTFDRSRNLVIYHIFLARNEPHFSNNEISFGLRKLCWYTVKVSQDWIDYPDYNPFSWIVIWFGLDFQFIW